MGDAAAGLPPDLRAGGQVVGLRVGRVGVLVELRPARTGAQLGRLRHGALGLAGHRAQVVVQLDQVGAEEPQRRPLLQRDRLRHGRGEAVVAGVGDHRQADPGVPRGRLDKVLQFDAAVLRVRDQVRGHPVLHRAERVVPLQLGVHLRVLEAGDALQPDDRSRVLRVGQQIDDRVVAAQVVVGHRALSVVEGIAGYAFMFSSNNVTTPEIPPAEAGAQGSSRAS